jgi:hypothetical protein
MPSLSPGTYLRRRREAAGLSIDDVALTTDTFPQTCARYRADLIASIEADDIPITPGTAIVLRMRYVFDPLILDQLAMIHAGSMILEPRICRVCACSWNDPCRDASAFGRCAWSKDDDYLCTSCVDKPEAALPTADVVELAQFRIDPNKVPAAGLAHVGLDLGEPT